MIALIAACEIAFWVLLVSGLTARYLLRRKRIGPALLLATPAVDLVLLAATLIDVRGGAEATPAHVLAAIYLGFSVGYGHYLVGWADARFAHRFAGGPPPIKRPKNGPGRAAHERTQWLRHLIAYLVGIGVMRLAVWTIDDSARSEPFTLGMELWTALLVLDFVVSFSYSVRQGPQTPARTATAVTPPSSDAKC